MQWLAAFHRALNNVHSAVSQHNSDTIEQPVLDFYFWTSRKPRTARRSTRRASHTQTIHKTTILPRHCISSPARDQTEQPERGKLDGKRGGA